MFKKVIVFAVMACTYSVAFSDGGRGLVYDWDFSLGSGDVEPSEIRDRMHVSATATATDVYTGASEAPEKIRFIDTVVTNWFYPNLSTKMRRCVYFPGEVRVNGTVTNTCRRAMELPGSVEGSATLFINFRYDRSNYTGGKDDGFLFGNAYADTKGWGLGIYSDAIPNETSTYYNKGLFWLTVNGNKHSFLGSPLGEGKAVDPNKKMGCEVPVGKWHTMVITLEDNGSQVMYKIRTFAPFGSGRPGFCKVNSIENGFPNTTLSGANGVASSGNYGKMFLGAETSDADWQTPSRTKASYFHGAVSHLKLWNRVLSEDEIMAAVSEQWSSTWQIGSKNGSGEEFAEDGSSEIETVFDPRTMPCRKMRRSLTAANPSITISSYLDPASIGLNRVLEITPVSTDSLAEAKVAVYVNSAYVGTADLKKPRGREFFIKGSRMSVVDKTCSITLTRTGDLSGSLDIDAIRLTGGWLVGSSASATLGTTGDVPEFFSVGETNFSVCSKGAYNSNRRQMELGFYVPKAAAESSAYTFTTDINPQGNAENVSFYINGVQAAVRYKTDSRPWTFTFPAGTMQPGLNVMRIYNDNDLNYATAWYFMMDVGPYPRGMGVTIR